MLTGSQQAGGIECFAAGGDAPVEGIALPASCGRGVRLTLTDISRPGASPAGVVVSFQGVHRAPS